MRYATAAAFRRALEQRLLTQSNELDIPLIRLRKLVVFDRLMARLAAVALGRWVLKGAVALHFRSGPQFRTTKDLDLGRQDDEEAATADFRLAQSTDLGDYFSFNVERTARLDPALERVAVRYHVSAELDGRAFEDVTVDVGFGEGSWSEAEVLSGPDLLSFAGISPAQVPTISIEQHVAEKVHAYTRIYAGGPTSRVKDLIDMVVIASLFPVRADRLKQALELTFAARHSHSLPGQLPPPPKDWVRAYERLASELGLDRELDAGYEAARVFLDPLLGGVPLSKQSWDPKNRSW